MNTITRSTKICVGLASFLFFFTLASAQEVGDGDLVNVAQETDRCENLLDTDEGTAAQRQYCVDWLDQNTGTAEERAERQMQRADEQAERTEAQSERQTAREQARESRQSAREEAQTTRQENREIRQEERTERIEERRAALTERIQERVTNLAANVSNRMDAATGRIQNIIDRLESRMDKLTENGVDTAEAAAILESAQLSLDAAVGELATIDADVAAAVGAENPREAWRSVRAQYAEVRDLIRTAFTEVRASVSALKEAVRANSAGDRGVSEAVDASATGQEPCPENLPAPNEPGYDPMQYADCQGAEVVEDEAAATGTAAQ